ncbi:LysM peptidoglycan-binding domain-containing protein [Marinobacterium arenosum]|uniref:LysM peptidoglycan-binding domain-containing protein n=1 Tax=Marinobacterium arenosum TaxID=2862496 RepID=UPI001C95496F|nr:LysM peptidoglycan-binding domain-containing protein [Marinobacterium arenosum]MBY4677254.1 LysM peptidoglycan-binding domain-containing protein [Marinobacterium arenosum]
MIFRPFLTIPVVSTLILSGCQSLPQQQSSIPATDNTARTAEARPTEKEKVTTLASALRNVIGLENQPDSERSEQSPQAVAAEEPDDLWQLTRQHFKLDLEQSNRRIDAQLSWYARHPKYINRVADRASRYYHHIINEVIARDMPAELALLPIVESAFDPFAYSHGRAAGPWQFIPGTGKRFGLRQGWWYDGRRDVVASTRAALDYLDLLQKRYDGDWLLALAAYNAGEGNVDRAVKRNRRAGKPTDFWSLKLPKETQAYVPKLLAVAKLFNEPERYQLSLKPLPNKPYFEVVETQGQIDLAEAANLAEISMEELYLLNPGFNRWATDPKGPHYLAIPADKAEAFAEKLAKLPPEKRMKWTRYTIKSGDSLGLIAKRFKTTPDVIRTANSLRGNRIRAGAALLIPTAAHNSSEYVLSQAQRQQRTQQKIARNSNKQKRTYTVKSGDSFWSISRKYKVGVRSLASWNQMAPGDPLSIGKQLVIWQEPNQKLASAGDGRQLVRKIGYKVRSGDSLARIAGRFNVKINDITRWNKLDKQKYLQPGQRLTLYVDITR